MYASKTRQTVIALFAGILFTCAFASMPYVHKHFPSHQGAADDYDASCSWVKTEKNIRVSPLQQLLALAPLTFFLFTAVLIFFFLAETSVFGINLCHLSGTLTRAPPAC